MTISTKIVIDLGSGVAIRDGLTASSSDEYASCDLTDFSTGAGVARKWATYEPDSWLLDGSFYLIPEAAGGANIGFLSDGISDSLGDFATAPELTITFDADYTLTTGILLQFNSATGDYCTDVDITFKNSGGGTLASQNYIPSGVEYFCELPSATIASVRSIVLAFNSTNDPYRHVRLTDMVVDVLIFGNDKLQGCTLIEEIDPVSVELSANSLEFSVYDANGGFNPFDPAAQYEALQYKQTVDAYIVASGVETYMGRFYLEHWEADSAYKASFRAYDAIWLLGETPYRGNVWWYPDPNIGGDAEIDIENLLDDLIVDLAGLTYSIDASLTSITMKGVLICTNVREALQQICFAIGGYADCSRSSTINIVPITLPQDIVTPDFEFTNAVKGLGAKPSLRPLVTGVEVGGIYLTINSSPPSQVLVDETFATGTYYIVYEPNGIITDWVVVPSADPNTTISPVDRNKIQIDVDAGPTAVSIQVAEIYEVNRRTYSQYNLSLPAGTPANVIVVDEAAFAIAANGQAITDRLYDYLLNRVVYNIRAFGETSLTPGMTADIYPDVGSQHVYGVIEKMTTDLTRGFISSVEIIGVAA